MVASPQDLGQLVPEPWCVGETGVCPSHAEEPPRHPDTHTLVRARISHFPALLLSRCVPPLPAAAQYPTRPSDPAYAASPLPRSSSPPRRGHLPLPQAHGFPVPRATCGLLSWVSHYTLLWV